MERSPTDEESLHIHGLASQTQKQAPGLTQDTGKQTSSTAQHIRNEAAGSDRTDTESDDTSSVASNQAETQHLEEHRAQVFVSSISGPVPCSLDQLQHVATTSSEETRQDPPLTLSAHTQTEHNDIPAQVELSPSISDTVSSNATPHCSPPLQISESLGLEGCAGIFGGFVGVLGVLGFLAFLWFGGKLPCLQFCSIVLRLLSTLQLALPRKLPTPLGCGGSWRYGIGCRGRSN